MLNEKTVRRLIILVATVLTFVWVGCSPEVYEGDDDDDDDDKYEYDIVADTHQESCELQCEQYQECYPGFDDWYESLEVCKEECDPEVYIEHCQADCDSEYEDGTPDLEACKNGCVYDMYETVEEHCLDWCTNGGGDCDYCDDIFNEPCQSAYLTYENCALSLDCEDLDDATDICEDEKDAIVDACNCF